MFRILNDRVPLTSSLSSWKVKVFLTLDKAVETCEAMGKPSGKPQFDAPHGSTMLIN